MTQSGTEGGGYIPVGPALKNRYEILHEIGRGGYSVVYSALDRELDARVAVKLLVPPPADAEVARERMRREVQAVRGLSHTHIVAVHDFIEEGPWSFIVMELVKGPDLFELVKDAGPLSVDQVVEIGRGTADALSLAHDRGILHRDIKPRNILIDPDGRARLTDFGSARLDGEATVTRTGGLVGTIQYAAPEVLAGRRADARADIYALGMTLYFALTGQMPQGRSPHLPPPALREGYRPVARRHDVPDWLDAIVARATAATPADRFPTATALARALARGGAPSSASPIPRRDLKETCFICGTPEPLGLGVCAACGGNLSAGSEALIFVKRSPYATERVAIAERLQELLADRVDPQGIDTVALGHRALVRVSEGGAQTVVEQLAMRDIPARAVPSKRAWAPLPLRLYGFVGFVTGSGLLAGSIASSSSLLVASPAVGGLLLALAQVRLRRPLIVADRRKSGLPPEVEARVVETLQSLRAGAAAGLLADIVRIAENLYLALPRTGDPADIASQLGRLIEGACEAAVELADLDETLARLEARREILLERAAGWIDAHARCERASDRLVHRLLAVTTALGEARGRSAERLLAAAAQDLDEATRDVERHFETHAEAAKEVEELLERSGAGSGQNDRFDR